MAEPETCTTSNTQRTDRDETANVALLPCPFCGPGESIVEPWHDDVAKRWRVGCGRCGCSTGISPRDKTKAPAIEAWNRRAAPTLPADVAKLVREYRPTMPAEVMHLWAKDVLVALTAQAALLDRAMEDAEWHSPDEVPDTQKGTEHNFIVAVRRARSGKVYSFPSAYLNAYPLRYEYECPKGDGCEGEGCEDGCPITGWYSATGDGEDGLTYSPMYMDPGDEFLGWRQVPQWPAASRLHHEMGGDRG